MAEPIVSEADLDLDKLYHRRGDSRAWPADADRLCVVVYTTGEESAACALIDCLQEAGWSSEGAAELARRVLSLRAASIRYHREPLRK